MLIDWMHSFWTSIHFAKKIKFYWLQILNGSVYINHLNTVHIYVNMTKVKETNLLVQILEMNWM